MARKSFKHWWTRFIPRSVERSTYVLCASLMLLLLFWQWRPMPDLVWTVTDPMGWWAIKAVSLFGWGVVVFSTFLISHFELFGLTQVLRHWMGQPTPEPVFRTPLLYRQVRHPIYLGFLIAFWATPVMTVGHLLFAVMTTAYILIAIQLEERDLVRLFGPAYTIYRERVAMLFPRLWGGTTRMAREGSSIS